MNISTAAVPPFYKNGFLVSCEETRDAVIIDPGDEVDTLIARARSSGVRVVAILLTHAHLDHIDGIATVRDAFPDVPIHLHPADRSLYDRAPQQAAAFGLPPFEVPPPTHELAAGQRIEFGGCTLEVRHAPGHSPGHVILYAEADGLALVGDVVFAGSIGRTDLPGGDFRALIESIRREVLTLPPATRLLPGHGGETTVEWEARHNPFLVPHYGGELA